MHKRVDNSEQGSMAPWKHSACLRRPSGWREG
jgi:hypothetical protein